MHDFFKFFFTYGGSLIAGILLLVVAFHFCGVIFATIVDWIDSFFERIKQYKAKRKKKKASK